MGITKLTINRFEEKTTRAGVPFWNFETSQGLMSCWDAVLAEMLMKQRGEIEVDTQLSKDEKYVSIRKLVQFDASPQETEGSEMPPVEVVKPSAPKRFDSEANKQAGVATRYAVDLCIAGKIDYKDLRLNAKLLLKLMKDLAG